MWTTEDLTDMGMAGIYANLRTWVYINNEPWLSHIAYEQWGYTGQFGYIESVTGGTATPQDLTFFNTWQALYEGIHRANDAIINIPAKSPVAETKKAKLVAEAKFLRALHYYRLNELYHGVPVYLEPITVKECIRGQETEETVWQQVIRDLTDCINEPNFPDIDLKEGRATRGAAYALRGKSFMQMKQWAMAAADFEKVGACGYELFDGGYKELFTEASERCREMIFSVQYITDNDYASYTQYFCGSYSAYGDNNNLLLVSPQGVDLYENLDGTPFNWNDVIPGYTDMEPADREVFFLRDTVGIAARYLIAFPAIGSEHIKALAQQVCEEVEARLDRFSPEVRALHLPGGNEARIRNAYTNRDPRLEMSVITPYATFRGVYNDNEQLAVNRWPMVSQSIADLFTSDMATFYYLHRKFVYEGNRPIPSSLNCPTDEPMIRYADVLLLWAEALTEQGRLSDAAEKVNRVRARPSVDMPPVQYTSQDELREKIRNERRIEFINEGINFFDEMRWRTWEDSKFKDGNGVTQVWGEVVVPYVWPGDQIYTWPAPKAEIQNIRNLKPTPGWRY